MQKSKGLYFIRKNRILGYRLKYIFFFLFKRGRLQKKVSYGESNPDKTIYIIKPDSEDCVEGLLSLLARTTLYIRYAVQKRYIPFIDWKNYKTQYFNEIDNAWEFFFEQPSKLTIEEVYRSKNVYLSGWTIKDINPNAVYGRAQFFDRKLNEECHALLTDFLEFSDEVKDLVDTESQRLGIENCLGVYIRGTDYVEMKPSGEYVQPTVVQVTEKIDEFLKKYGGIGIYLVTEDGHIYDQLKENYKEQILLVSFDCFIYKYNGGTFLSKSNVLDNNKKKRGINYLVKMILLSRCKYLISSITMGSMFSYGLNGNKYEDEYIFDLGLYP